MLQVLLSERELLQMLQVFIVWLEGVASDVTGFYCLVRGSCFRCCRFYCLIRGSCFRCYRFLLSG